MSLFCLAQDNAKNESEACYLANFSGAPVVVAGQQSAFMPHNRLAAETMVMDYYHSNRNDSDSSDDDDDEAVPWEIDAHDHYSPFDSDVLAWQTEAPVSLHRSAVTAWDKRDGTSANFAHFEATGPDSPARGVDAAEVAFADFNSPGAETFADFSSPESAGSFATFDSPDPTASPEFASFADFSQ